MKLVQLELDDKELPSGATLRVSGDEALYLAQLLATVSGVQAEELMTGGAEVSADLYEGLAYKLFDRFYEGGLAEAARLHG